MDQATERLPLVCFMQSKIQGKGWPTEEWFGRMMQDRLFLANQKARLNGFQQKRAGLKGRFPLK
jgi:hypothetical protein